jgi:hypothetical protein
MNSMSSGASAGMMYFARKLTKAVASLRPRRVVGLKPGSTALICNLGFSRANSRAVARVHCFDVAYESNP